MFSFLLSLHQTNHRRFSENSISTYPLASLGASLELPTELSVTSSEGLRVYHRVPVPQHQRVLVVVSSTGNAPSGALFASAQGPPRRLSTLALKNEPTGERSQESSENPLAYLVTNQTRPPISLSVEDAVLGLNWAGYLGGLSKAGYWLQSGQHLPWEAWNRIVSSNFPSTCPYLQVSVQVTSKWPSAPNEHWQH